MMAGGHEHEREHEHEHEEPLRSDFDKEVSASPYNATYNFSRG